MMLFFGNYRWPKLDKLHRAKERHTPSLSNQTSVYTLLPEGGVVWNLPYSICVGEGLGEGFQLMYVLIGGNRFNSPALSVL